MPVHGHAPNLDRVARRRRHAVVAAIAAGGFLGTLSRYEVGLAWKTGPGRFPWATFTINTSGAFLLGIILTMLLERTGSPRYLRPFACVGVLGAWTTMSSLALEADLLARDGRVATALAYVGLTMLAGLSLAWAGILLGRSGSVKGLRWRWR